MNSRYLVVICWLWLGYSQQASADPVHLRVMSFNLWVGGEAGGQPLATTIDAIKKGNPDIVGLQETHGIGSKDRSRPDNGKIIAEKLGWNYLQQGGRTGILTRFEIVKTTPRKWGATLRVNSSTTIQFFNAHFAPSPYQPYQLLKIPYGNAPFIKTEADAIEWAKRARGKQVDSLLTELGPALKKPLPVFLTGDFNEPSHQDWTARSAAAKLCPIKVTYPTTQRITKAGLVDTFRAAHPDETKQRGLTWTSTTDINDPKDRHDRIDFVFASRRGVKVKDCHVVGENKQYADIVLKPWPSDHRAVLAEVELAE